MVYNVDFESGRINWERELHRGVPPIAKHIKNTFASETPVTDGERVYVYLGDIGLFAFEFDGAPAWSVPMEWLPRRDWGSATSPALHDGRLYVVNDNTTESFLIALDTATGDTVWRVVREETENWSPPWPSATQADSYPSSSATFTHSTISWGGVPPENPTPIRSIFGPPHAEPIQFLIISWH